MFARSAPRAALRVGRLAQYEVRPQIRPWEKLPAGARGPVQRQCGRQLHSSFKEQFRDEFRKSPILFPFALGGVLLVASIAVFYVPYYYRNVIIKPYHKFPEPVAKKLRKAIFYSSGAHMDLREANKYFRQALQTAQEIGMDPFTDEILGVKLAIATIYENAGHHQVAAEVMEVMRADCKRWMAEYSDKHWNDGMRSRVLKRIVELNVKLGQLYDVKYMNEPDEGEKVLTEAVEMALKEKARRENEGIKEGEGDWMTDEELGGTLEALGQHYEQFDAHYLATPLFLQALALCPPKSCHRVVLMNNISTCLAQQTPPPLSATLPQSATDSFPNTPPPSRATLIEQAKAWANRAIAKAATISPPDRNEECDIGCATATHNLGEFFEMEGKLKEARQQYDEAASLAKALSFSEGYANAKAGLHRLKELERRK
ncbi:hypothetical protein CC78DRAFT_531798 [Lojkania enalia]|uniref:TPR domain-containing protein n=1 Tax=Lojkania enalia TaxID=147567 RepID=A0A9P4KE07_9PLEO|nr:hypothetical protein CC78DRAFT_531798 [Didymosphaeria enalia]